MADLLKPEKRTPDIRNVLQHCNLEATMYGDIIYGLNLDFW
jgi:hypothetical protein